MIWLTLVASAAVIILAATFLARYGDAIAQHTRLGGMLIGAILLAAATSLPELLTSVSSIRQNVPNLAAGNLFGSNMFNIFLLGVLDMATRRVRLLRQVALRHTLIASLAVLLSAMAVFFLLAQIGTTIGWVGLDSLLLIVTYILGVWVIRTGNPFPSQTEERDVGRKAPRLLIAILGFVVASAVLVLAVPYLVRSSAAIAEVTGLGTGFVGIVLVAFVTSLPEVVTVFAAVRIGAFDLAVGNLFGSNAFNIFALALTDLFDLEGRFLARIDPFFALAGLLGLILTTLGLIGNVARLERRLFFIELDALLLIVVYLAGVWILYRLGIGT